MKINKRMKVFLFVCLVLFSYSHLFSQVILSGQVKDKDTKQNLEFCNVAVFSKDSLVTGSITNNKGYYSIPLKPGKYTIVVSLVGYFPDTIKNISINNDLFIGIHKLKQKEIELKEVQIKESSKISKIDRDEYVVTEDLRKNTFTAKEVLDKLNGVTLDRYSGKIKVDNSDKVIILVDGLEKDQEYVKNLNPERLKKIEVIRDPGGKYGLDGYTAVINIILKKNYQGIELFYNNNSMLDADANKEKLPLFPSMNNYLSFNYIYNNINFYVKPGLWFNNFQVKSSIIKNFNDTFSIEQLPENDNVVNGKFKSFTSQATLGCDYYLNPKNTISYEGKLSIKPKKHNLNFGKYIMKKYLNNILLEEDFVTSSSVEENFYYYHSFHYLGKYDKNNELIASLTLNKSNSKGNSIYETLLASINNLTESNVFNYSFYSNYTHNLSDKSSFQLGYANNFLTQDNIIINYENNSKYKIKDIRNRGFIYYNWTIFKWLTTKFGGVLENSTPKSNTEKRNYSSIQPYGDIKIKPFDFINIRGKYRTNYSYPSITQTNPSIHTIDNTTLKKGNPNLKPSLTHKLSAQLNVYEGFISIEPYYHFSNNMITEICTNKNNGIIEYSYDNSGKYINKGWKSSIAFPITRKIFVQNSFDFYESSISTSIKSHKVNDWQMTSQLIYYNEKSNSMGGLIFQKNMSRVINSLGWEKEDINFWMIILQQQFFKNKLSVMVGYILPISWGIDSYNQGSLYQTNEYREEKIVNVELAKNFLIFEISYRFSKGRSLKETEKIIQTSGEEKIKKGIF